MYWKISCAAAALAALCVIAAPAAADDAITCRDGASDDAIAACSRVLQRDPKYAAAYFGRGFAYSIKGENDRAFADIDQALRLDPKVREANILRGTIHQLRGEDDRATADFDEAIKNNPQSAIVAHSLRGIAYIGRGAYDRAMAELDQVIRLQHNGSPDPHCHVRGCGEIHAFRGMVYQYKGEYDRAIAELDEEIKLDPEHASAYVSRGTVWRLNGDFDRAIADFDQAITLDPDFASAYVARGVAWNKKGAYDRAIVDFDRAVILDPRASEHNWGAALADWALGLPPPQAVAYAARGDAYAGKGDYARAIADYDEALKRYLPFADARRNRERAQAALAPRAEPKQTAAAPQANPQRRAALIVGNSAYRAAPVLPNPRRDAEAIAEALRQAGFTTVDLALDLDRAGMVKALQAFRDEADRADWAMVYFAGHGIEIDRVNYLIPVDAQLHDDRDVEAETVSYRELLKTVDGARALRLVVLDACRNNPFKERMRRSLTMRSTVDRGLAAPSQLEPGTLVVYSAQEGEVASDDAGGTNSPFARAFVDQLKVPGREVRRLFDYVRDDVLRTTNKRQQPWTYGSLPGAQDFFFVSAK
jgi:tetratricopeptide (TPR) repeat protein